MPKSAVAEVDAAAAERRAHAVVSRTASSSSLARRGQLHADVEHHRDVDADRFLKRDDVLGREAMLAAVEVRAKRDAVVVELAPRLEAEDLKAAGVGEDRAVPRHEAVQAAGRFDGLAARAQPQMIGVREHDLRAVPRAVPPASAP